MKNIKYFLLTLVIIYSYSCASLSLFSPETHNHYTSSNDSSSKNEPVVNSFSEVKSIGENVVKPTNEDDFMEEETETTGVNLPSTPTMNAFDNTQK